MRRATGGFVVREFTPREIREAISLPFASPNAFVLTHVGCLPAVALVRLSHHSPAPANPKSLSAFSLRISGRTSGRISVFSRSASHRSGVISG